MIKKSIIWDKNKNEVLKKTRDISFEVIAQKIQKQEIIEIIQNLSPNYQNQYIIVIEHQKYTWGVPVIITEKEIILKTAFPSRKLHKKYS